MEALEAPNGVKKGTRKARIATVKASITKTGDSSVVSVHHWYLRAIETGYNCARTASGLFIAREDRSGHVVGDIGVI